MPLKRKTGDPGERVVSQRRLSCQAHKVTPRVSVRIAPGSHMTNTATVLM